MPVRRGAWSSAFDHAWSTPPATPPVSVPGDVSHGLFIMPVRSPSARYGASSLGGPSPGVRHPLGPDGTPRAFPLARCGQAHVLLRLWELHEACFSPRTSWTPSTALDVVPTKITRKFSRMIVHHAFICCTLFLAVPVHTSAYNHLSVTAVLVTCE